MNSLGVEEHSLSLSHDHTKKNYLAYVFKEIKF